MKVALNSIKAMSKRVRESQSPEALDELAASIKESGVIVPVKLRKNGDEKYTIVYGHRRVAAAKMAGLTEIESIIEGVDEDALLTQALIENVVREDMNALDIAKALRTIKEETGASNEAIGAKMGWTRETIENYLRMLDPDLGLSDVDLVHIPARTVEEAVYGTGGDKKLAGQVLKKAIEGDEPLTRRNTRRLAEVTREANEFGGQKAVTQLLKQKADEILRQAKPVDEYKSKRPVTATKVEGEILFQWIKDSRVLLAEEGLKAVSSCVSDIARSKEDRGGGKAVLKNLAGRTQNLLNQINEVLDGYGN